MLNSCENNFDPNIYGSLFPGNYPKSEAEFETYALACYIPFGTQWTYDMGSGRQNGVYIPEGGVIRVFDQPTDVMAPWIIGGFNEWYYTALADYNNAVNYARGWGDSQNINHLGKLSDITRLTEIIGSLQGADPKILSETKRNQLMGEVLLCRANLMYFLMHLYGPLPVITDPAKVQDTQALENLVRPTLAEMAELVKSDMEQAVTLLPEKVAQQGRYTQDYARFCLMKHCLNEGEHMTGYYARAKEMYDQLNTGKYGLHKATANPFKDLFFEKNDFGIEIIMAISCGGNADGGDSNGNFFPLMMLAAPNNASRKNGDGSDSPFSKQGPGWMRTPFNVSPITYNKYAANDKRRETVLTEYWLVKDGDQWKTPTEKLGPNDIGNLWDGYIINKFPMEFDGFQKNDIPLARWADVLLMMAELDVRMSNGAPSQAAKQAVNDVRGRAGATLLSDAETASKEAFLSAILEERLKEFLYEGMRKIDLIRFNKYAQACYKTKKVRPTHQYMPLPNYFVQQAASYGKTLEQVYSRPGWNEDLSLAR